MIQLRTGAISDTAANELQGLQAEVDALPSYSEQVKAVPKLFKNATKRASFQEIKRVLETTAAGNARCMFCEDSAGNEIDHLRPKSLYPDACFSWPNYIYVCGVCNKAKLSQFAVFAESDRTFVDVTRRRGEPIVPPRSGSPVLIHPRYDDPMRLLRLDLTNSFYFHPLAQEGSEEHRRALYTIDTLKLNLRDPLVRQRRQYFEIYAGLVEHCLHAAEHELSARRDRIRLLGHPTVWFEMRRQHGSHPRLRELFAKLPEALLWDSVGSATNRWLADD